MKVAIEAVAPDEMGIERAADAIRAGRLVAFPTETVYGLGANALDADAVARIFAAKQRPATNPLIVHVASVEEARGLAIEWSSVAQALAREFWPGPLTLVLPRRARVPDVVTAGLDTVGLRMPAHPVAAALIRAAGCPIAAPSANLYMGISPTRPDHVERGLGAGVDLILDAGPTPVGIESTVVEVQATGVRLLRPGMVTAEQIGEITPILGSIARSDSEAAPRPSPGLSPRHYAPSCELRLIDDARSALARYSQDDSVGWMWCARASGPTAGPSYVVGATPTRYAENLYAVMHSLDGAATKCILVERPPDRDAWRGILDRLVRAAHR